MRFDALAVGQFAERSKTVTEADGDAFCEWELSWR